MSCKVHAIWIPSLLRFPQVSTYLAVALNGEPEREDLPPPVRPENLERFSTMKPAIAIEKDSAKIYGVIL